MRDPNLFTRSMKGKMSHLGNKSSWERTSASPKDTTNQGQKGASKQSKTGKKRGRTSASSKDVLVFKAMKRCAGIDMSHLTFDLCIVEKDAQGRTRIKSTRSFKNTPGGIKDCIAFLKKMGFVEADSLVVVEATGVYHENFAYACVLHEIPISIVLPNKSYHFGKSLNEKSKTDEIDARILAQMGLERNLEEWKPSSPIYLEIRELCRERRRIQQARTCMSNQRHAVKASHDPNKNTLDRQAKMLDYYDKQIGQIEKEIDALVKSDPEVKESVRRLETIKGVGFWTAVTVLAETDGFALFQSKAQVVSYSGYDIVSNNSGTSVRGRAHMSKKGNSRIRDILHLPSMTAMRYAGEMKDLYDRIIEKNPGMGKKGLVAVARKMLVLMYTLHKTKNDYDPHYREKKESEAKLKREQTAA